MTTGEQFLNTLAAFPPETLATRFSRIATMLHLGTALDSTELGLLFEAAFHATLCNIAIHRLGGGGGRIKPERETNRRGLEAEFMAARDRLYACAGWEALPVVVRDPVQRIFLQIHVSEENLVA